MLVNISHTLSKVIYIFNIYIIYVCVHVHVCVCDISVQDNTSNGSNFIVQCSYKVANILVLTLVFLPCLVKTHTQPSYTIVNIFIIPFYELS